MRVLITFEADARATIAEPSADYVWAINSGANRAAAELRWSAEGYRGVEVTVFDPQPLIDILPTVLEHHPDCDVIEVRGAEADGEVWAELRRHQFMPLRQSRGLVRAGRRSGAV